tara:strand:- start:1848 stop:2087 length:240 start_codon:yes stop_codon:yes gene_type:complete
MENSNNTVYQTNTKIHQLEAYCDVSLSFNSETRQFEIKQLLEGKISTTHYYNVLQAADSYKDILKARGIETRTSYSINY